MRALTAALYVAMFLLVSHLQGSAQAYLDPGTGSMVLQAAMAGIVAVLAIGRVYWYRLKGVVLRRETKHDGVLGE